MKIAQIVCTYPPYYGGMGNVVFNTASELVKLGHEVEVLTPQFYESKEIKPKTEPVEEEHAPELRERIDFATRLDPSFQYGNAAYIPQIQNELDRFDLVHLHYPFFGTANLVRRWKINHPDKPLVITYHMDNRAKGWLGLFFKYYSKYWLPKILGSADVLIGSSFDYIENSDARELFFENKSKWLELPFGVDIEKFFPREKPIELLKSLGLNSEIPLILFVGGMDSAHYFKGIPVLLEALLITKSKGLNFQAVLIGEGNLRPEFEQKAKFMGLEKQIRFVGKISDEDLPFYYNLADLLVLPSTTKAEAFGMVLLEAYASGVPVLASNLPGVRTIAELAGNVYEAGNRLSLAQYLLSYFLDQPDKSAWQAQARKVAEEKFSWEAIVGKLDKIYQQLA